MHKGANTSLQVCRGGTSPDESNIGDIFIIALRIVEVRKSKEWAIG